MHPLSPADVGLTQNSLKIIKTWAKNQIDTFQNLKHALRLSCYSRLRVLTASRQTALSGPTRFQRRPQLPPSGQGERLIFSFAPLFEVRRV